MHTHDFPELFLVERGSGTHTLPRERRRLVPDTVAFLLPEDTHGFSTRPDETLLIVNVAFPETELRSFIKSYGDIGWGPWRAPSRFCLPLRAQSRGPIRALFSDVLTSPRDRFTLHWFLLSLLRLLADELSVSRETPQIPQWYGGAVARFRRSPEMIAEGKGAFIALAAKSREHVSRTVPHIEGCSLSQFVNRLRLERAGALLTVSDRTILDIALECGFESASYFCRLFRERFGTTPQEYRTQHRGIVGACESRATPPAPAPGR